MSKGYLAAHVLDTAKGCLAHGLAVSFYAIEGTASAVLWVWFESRADE